MSDTLNGVNLGLRRIGRLGPHRCEGGASCASSQAFRGRLQPVWCPSLGWCDLNSQGLGAWSVGLALSSMRVV
jgi:hypothetical protein